MTAMVTPLVSITLGSHDESSTTERPPCRLLPRSLSPTDGTGTPMASRASDVTAGPVTSITKRATLIDWISIRSGLFRRYTRISPASPSPTVY